MTSRIGPGRWSATCWALVVLAAVLAQRGAAAEEFLYPHAECESGPWGYIDKTGRIVIPLQFQWAEPFSEGLAAVGLNKKSGFIDSTGRLVIQPRFDTVRAFRSGRASVRVGNDWGFIDGGGSEIIPLSYGFTWFFSGDRASVRVKGRAGAVDLSGQMVVAPEFETIDDFSEGLAPAKRNGKHGYIDKDGKVAIPFEFERAFPFQDGRAVVLQDANGRSGLIDKTGALVASFDFEMVHEFSEGLAVVWRKKKYGAIDIDGNVVISPRFTGVGITTEFEPNFRRTTLFSEGLLPVSDGRAYGYIDRHGRYAIEPQFRGAGPFRDGVAMVQMDATVALDPKAKGWLAGIIDRTGKLVAPPIYEWARVKPGGLVQVKFGERLGYLDSKGRPLTFTDKDIEAYLAKRREQLKPPAQGRAVVAKAGDTEYYLHLPESLCLLDDSQPADRKFIEDRWTESDQGFETRKALKPMSGDVEQAMRKSTEDLRRKSRFIIGCDQLGKLRGRRGQDAHPELHHSAANPERPFLRPLHGGRCLLGERAHVRDGARRRVQVVGREGKGFHGDRDLRLQAT